MTLNLEQLREDVVRLYGAKQWGLLSPCLYSIIDRKFYARFHFQEGMRLLKKFLNNKDDQNILIMLILNADREQYEEFYLRCKQAKAHVVACMQSMHALSDTLGHAVYFATGQNLARKVSSRVPAIDTTIEQPWVTPAPPSQRKGDIVL